MARQSSALIHSGRSFQPNAVPRQRLFHRLDELRRHPLVWVGGGAGAGKTTLLASYLAARNLAAIWYRVSPEDGDPVALLSRLRAAGTDGADRAARVNGRAAVGRTEEPKHAGRAVLRDLLNRLPRPGVLIVDDVHEIAHDSLLHALLVDCAADIASDVNVVLLGRGGPVSLYTRLIGTGALAVLDEREMQLTLEETRAVAGRGSIDVRCADALHGLCGGWAAGVSVTVERLRASGEDAREPGPAMRSALSNYFAGEVFDRATPEERRVLVSVALLPRVSAAAAQDLGGGADAHPLLARLAARQLFTRRLTGSPPTFEFLPLFREFLLSRLEDTVPAPYFETLARRAAAILETSGELDAAVALRVSTRDWSALSEMIGTHATKLLAQGHAATLRRWISALPATVAAENRRLKYWSAAAAASVDPSGARAQLRSAWTEFERNSDALGQTLAAASILDSYQYEWSSYEDHGVWMERLEALLEEAPSFPFPEMELGAHGSLLLALARAGAPAERITRASGRLHALLVAVNGIDHHVLGLRALLVGYCVLADVGAAREITGRLEAALGAGACSPATRSAGLVAIACGRLLEGDFSQAEAALREIPERVTERGVPVMDVLQQRLRLTLGFARRDATALGACLHAIRQAGDPTRHAALSLLSHAQAGQALLRGDIPSALMHWRTAAAEADAAAMGSMQWTARLALSGCLAAEGDCKSAARVLEEAGALSSRDPLTHSARDYALLRAYLTLRGTSRTACHRLLPDALAAGETVEPPSLAFMLLPAQMAELCAEALRAGLSVTAARGLIARYALQPAAGAGQEWPWPFKVTVLGRFQVLRDGAPLRFSRRMQRKPLELLQVLIAFGGTDVGAGKLTDALWPDSDGDAGYHALESALYRLRQLLGVPSAVTMSGGKLSLDRRQFWVDMWTFEREVQAPSRLDADPAARLARVRELYQGHFLEQEADKQWALKTREVLRERFVRSIRDAARAFESRRLWHEAASLYQSGLELDHLAEDLYRGLMVCHKELGDHGEAVQAYRRCRELLTRVLGVQPNAKTQAIYHSVQQNPVASPG